MDEEVDVLCGPCGCVVSLDHVCPYGSSRLVYRNRSSRASYDQLFGDQPGTSSGIVPAPPVDVVASSQHLSNILHSHADVQTKLTEQKQLVADKDAQLKALKQEMTDMKRKIPKKQPVLPQKIKCETLLSSLLSIVTSSYQAKSAKCQAMWKPAVPPPPPPPPPAAAPPGPLRIIIVQKNINPSYLTEREIKYEATGNADELFYFDSSSTPWTPTWHPMDSSLTAQIATIGTMSADKRTFTVKQGATGNYSYNSHTYNVTVYFRPYPQPPPPPPPPPPVPPAAQVPWEAEVLLKGECVVLDKTVLKSMLDTHDFTTPDRKGSGTLIANLANLFTSFGTQYSFDSKKSELWVKPHWIKTWLTCAISRDYLEARIVMHGMKDGPYDKLFNDCSSSDPMKSNLGNAKGHGFYVSASNEIATHYGKRAATTARGGARVNHGTALIGLILLERNKCSDPTRQHDNGAFAFYPLASTIGVNVKYPTGHSTSGAWCDAFCVRDQTIFLPLGLAFAKK